MKLHHISIFNIICFILCETYLVILLNLLLIFFKNVTPWTNIYLHKSYMLIFIFLLLNNMSFCNQFDTIWTISKFDKIFILSHIQYTFIYCPPTHTHNTWNRRNHTVTFLVKFVFRVAYRIVVFWVQDMVPL